MLAFAWQRQFDYTDDDLHWKTMFATLNNKNDIYTILSACKENNVHIYDSLALG